MAVTSPALRQVGRLRRVGVVAGLAVLALAASHGALWWWIGGRIERQVAATIAAPGLPGWRATAEVRRGGGWPLAVRVEVAGLVVTAPLAGIDTVVWRAEHLSVAIELAHPRTLMLAVSGRQEIQMGAEPPTPVRAARMRAQVPLEPGVPTRAVTIEVVGLEAGLPGGRFALGQLDITAETRPAAQQGEPAATLGVVARAVELPPVREWPLGPRIERLDFDLVVTGPVPRAQDLAERAEAWRDGGGALELRRLELVWGEVTVAGGATLALDGQLQPMGAATARVGGHSAALRALTASGALTPRSALTAGVVLGLMARPPSAGGAPVVEVPLTLQNRTLSLGRIPLRRLPNLVWRPPP